MPSESYGWVGEVLMFDQWYIANASMRGTAEAAMDAAVILVRAIPDVNPKTDIRVRKAKIVIVEDKGA